MALDDWEARTSLVEEELDEDVMAQFWKRRRGRRRCEDAHAAAGRAR
jgi:hypothetical protein